MSSVAEFAARIYQECRGARTQRPREPLALAARTGHLNDMRAVIFDVYGTLIDYWRPGFNNPQSRRDALLEAFGSTVERFGFARHLREMNPADPPEKTLHDLYHGLIALDHEKSRKGGVETPEIRVEQIWQVILMMLRRHGYQSAGLGLGAEGEIARCVAFYYNFQALGGDLFSGVIDALAALKKDGLKLGIVSNAQFYTPIDLTLLVREQSGGAYDDYLELFDPDLVFYSFEYGVSKPGRMLFEKLYNSLYELQILPAQAVFVGNDLDMDVRTAQEIGMATALFCGDRQSTFLHGLAGVVVPDICFQDFEELPRLVSFHGGGKAEP